MLSGFKLENAILNNFRINIRIEEAAMLKKSTFPITITILLFAFTCGQQEGTYTIEMKDGVKYIHNLSPAWGDEPKVELEFVQKIGDLETEDENYQLYKLQDIAVDKDGNIYVLDAGNYRIQKFDKHGEYLATFGRKGQGPSEFQSMVCIEMDSLENIFVIDYLINKLIILDNKGKEIRRVQCNFKHDIGDYRFSQADEIISGNYIRNEAIPLISVYDKDFTLLREFGDPVKVDDNSFIFDFNVNDWSLDSYGSIYLSFRNQNRIEKYSSNGMLQFRFDRLLNYTVEIEKKKYTMKGPVPREIEYVEVTKVSNGNGIDYRGRLWVLSFKCQPLKDLVEEDVYQFEIFNPDGILLGTLPAPILYSDSIIILRIFGSRLFIIDSLKEMCVYEYKIVEK